MFQGKARCGEVLELNQGCASLGTMITPENPDGRFSADGSCHAILCICSRLTGVARAVYAIDCPTDEDAQARAEKFLEAHPAVELWDGPRRVARLVRGISDDEPPL